MAQGSDFRVLPLGTRRLNQESYEDMGTIEGNGILLVVKTLVRRQV
ncbi:MAG: hypothetical protein IH856_14425 [Deltaproteobacteria bacterium]|nr:hypothetical protein [Deltaproteobacteria bacterium]MCZ6450414.1 hypothetical protein [Deltaproteobacteria bacterium]MCZ6547269.1 hypothetical protein [Deltaproteobacteria bacterium]